VLDVASTTYGNAVDGRETAAAVLNNSERRVAAAGTLATDLAGGKATSAATARVAGIIHSTGSGVIVPGSRPAWFANSCQAHRPPAMPSGMPTMSATAVTVATCQNATALRSLRNIPSTFSSAKSRRRRRPDARMN
jgi:hypothetical protein